MHIALLACAVACFIIGAMPVNSERERYIAGGLAFLAASMFPW